VRSKTPASGNGALYPALRDAGAAIRRGWAKGTWMDDSGNVCLVASVSQALGQDDLDHLPADAKQAIAAQLRFSPAYWLGRGLAHRNHQPEEWAFAVWNDVPWRRRRHVTGLLDTVAARYETDWLRHERERLTRRVAELEAETSQLRARITELEEQNERLLRRILNYRSLRSDHEALERLDTELSQTNRDLLALLPAS
jgi:hypothetical protein